jgi:hypothetical protein
MCGGGCGGCNSGGMTPTRQEQYEASITGGSVYGSAEAVGYQRSGSQQSDIPYRTQVLGSAAIMGAGLN